MPPLSSLDQINICAGGVGATELQIERLIASRRHGDDIGRRIEIRRRNIAPGKTDRSISLVGVMALLPTFRPSNRAGKASERVARDGGAGEVHGAGTAECLRETLCTRCDAFRRTRDCIARVATSRPVTPVAMMLVLMSSEPPFASTTPEPESAPVIVPVPLIVAPELLTMPVPPVELRVPPEMAIVPPELSVIVAVELSVSPLAMVIAAELVMPLLAVSVAVR